MQPEDSLAYEVDDRPPVAVSLGVGLQGVVLSLGLTVMCVAFIADSGHVPRGWLPWAMFAALVVNGIVGAVQASRFGTGAMLVSGGAPIFLVVSASALAQGGPGLLACLVVAASLFQFAIAAWLPALRRIVTPVVSGTMIMLIAVGVMPVAVEGLGHVPAGASAFAGWAGGMATLAVAGAMALRAAGGWRLWSPVAGILAGWAVMAALGAYDARRVSEAPWVGFPAPVLPELGAIPWPAFWSLLPLFLIVSLSVAIKCTGAGIVMQRASTNRRRAADFRSVQRTVRGNALGSALAGAAGVPPVMPYEAISMSLAKFTGVAARRTGYYAAAFTAALAFLPKLTALLVTIPAPVLGAYMLMVMGMLMVEGMKTVVHDGLDARKGLVVALALSLGVGLETRSMFADALGESWGALLDNGITVGVLAAIAMTTFMEATGPRRRRLRVDLAASSLRRLDEFLSAVAADRGWTVESGDRLRSVGEEALESLLRDGGRGERRLTVIARPGRAEVELEFLAGLRELNVEDEVLHLGDVPEAPDLDETSLRLLRHRATSVRHRKYHGVDVVSVTVEGLR